MTRTCYVHKNFRAESAALIELGNEIVEEYQAAGFILTLRQLYYQLVARGHIENSQRSYKRVGSVVNDARLAGLMDWEAIEDRTREIRALPHWTGPGDVIGSAAYGYGKDLWAGQARRVEVWIEKDALVGVFEGKCQAWDVPLFSCRGYTSQSEVWRAAGRMIDQGPTVVLHFGDHDPSGMDMTRDIQDRLRLFNADVDVRRIALNMDQVEQYTPPPNPAKLSDSRAQAYIREHGDSSWELDALTPQVLAELVHHHVQLIVDENMWTESKLEQEDDRTLLMDAADRWDEIEEFLNGC